MSTQFAVGPTRDVQAGDTPDLNDGLLSRAQTNENIARGQACFLIDGFVTIADQTNDEAGDAPFVPIESVDNSLGSAGDTEMSGVAAPQRVALNAGTSDMQITFFPGDYAKVSDVPGQVEPMENGDLAAVRYARYLGKEAALLDRDPVTPFDETLTPGIVPDENLVVESGFTGVGWFQLVESQGVKGA